MYFFVIFHGLVDILIDKLRNLLNRILFNIIFCRKINSLQDRFLIFKFYHIKKVKFLKTFEKF